MNRSDYEKLYKVLSATLDPYKTENTLDKIVVDFRELHKTVRGTRIALRTLDSAVNDVFCDPDFCESHGIWLTSEIEGHLRLLVRVSRPVPDDVSLETVLREGIAAGKLGSALCPAGRFDEIAES